MVASKASVASSTKKFLPSYLLGFFPEESPWMTIWKVMGKMLDKAKGCLYYDLGFPGELSSFTKWLLALLRSAASFHAKPRRHSPAAQGFAVEYGDVGLLDLVRTPEGRYDGLRCGRRIRLLNG